MAQHTTLRLSVLDQSPIRKGSNAVEALQESITLARLADRLGYTRYWLSEHHNIRSLAGSAARHCEARAPGSVESKAEAISSYSEECFVAPRTFAPLLLAITGARASQ